MSSTIFVDLVRSHDEERRREKFREGSRRGDDGYGKDAFRRPTGSRIDEMREAAAPITEKLLLRARGSDRFVGQGDFGQAFAEPHRMRDTDGPSGADRQDTAQAAVKEKTVDVFRFEFFRRDVQSESLADAAEIQFDTRLEKSNGFRDRIKFDGAIIDLFESRLNFFFGRNPAVATGEAPDFPKRSARNVDGAVRFRCEPQTVFKQAEQFVVQRNRGVVSRQVDILDAAVESEHGENLFQSFDFVEGVESRFGPLRISTSGKRDFELTVHRVPADRQEGVQIPGLCSACV